MSSIQEILKDSLLTSPFTDNLSGLFTNEVQAWIMTHRRVLNKNYTTGATSDSGDILTHLEHLILSGFCCSIFSVLCLSFSSFSFVCPSIYDS